MICIITDIKPSVRAAFLCKCRMQSDLFIRIRVYYQGKENIFGGAAMKKNLTEAVFILDRSGSMSGLEKDTIGGFNSMIEKQRRQEGEVLVTTVLFDNESVVIHDRKRLEEVLPMSEKEYCVGGCTALLDAVGGTVEHIRKIHKYIREEDVPEHTIFVITTDGMENASKKYDYSQVKELIDGCKRDGWEFIFMGANIDAADVAGKMGIRRECAVKYVSDPAGTRLNYEAMSDAVSLMRAGCRLDSEWKKKIEKDEEGRHEPDKNDGPRHKAVLL